MSRPAQATKGWQGRPGSLHETLDKTKESNEGWGYIPVVEGLPSMYEKRRGRENYSENFCF